MLYEVITKLLEVTDNAIKNMPEVPQWYFYKAITQTQQNNYQGALTSSNEALKVCVITSYSIHYTKLYDFAPSSLVILYLRAK